MGRSSPSRNPSTPIITTRTSKMFKEGEMVKLKRKPPKPGYEDARILGKNTDGTYDVRGEDSGIERNVLPARIVAMPAGNSGASGAGESKADGAAVDLARNFRMGQKIEAMHPRQGKWVGAMVVSVNVQEGSLDIRFQTGEEQKGGMYSRWLCARDRSRSVITYPMSRGALRVHVVPPRPPRKRLPLFLPL